MTRPAADMASAPLRYGYVKNGDAVEQVELFAREGAVGHGPDAFVTGLLESLAEHPMLLLSRHRRFARLDYRNIRSKVYNAGVRPWSKALLKPLAWVRIVFGLLRFRPERIICGCIGSRLWAATLAAKLTGAPIVYSGHNRLQEPTDPWLRRLISWVDCRVLPHVDGFVCHGPYLAQELTDLGVLGGREPIEFDVELEGLEAELAATPLESAASSRSVLFVGRLEAEKGVFDLLEAATAHLRRQAIELVYIGGGRVAEELRRRAERAGVSERVHLMGRIPHEDVLPVIRRATVMVTPSRPDFPEGRCMAAMEALALGVPVIAPDFGPFPYLVSNDDNGLLFRPGDVADLGRCLDRLLDEPAVAGRLSEGARRSAVRLRKPPRTFAEALEAAFQGAPPGTAGVPPAAVARQPGDGRS